MTSKVYEILAVGSIPIVERSGYDCAFEHLPVLLVERLDQLDLTTLMERYREIACDTSKQHYDALTLGYWQTWVTDVAQAAAALGRGHRFDPAAGDPGPRGIYARACARGPNMRLRRDDPDGVMRADMVAHAYSVAYLGPEGRDFLATWKPPADAGSPTLDGGEP